MPDGPVVALIFLVVGGALVGLYFYVEHRRHARERGRAREPERLPLFGTDLLATRSEDGTVQAPDLDGDASRPQRRVPPIQRPTVDRHETPPGFSAPGFTAPGSARPAPGLARAPAFAPPFGGSASNGAGPGAAFAPVASASAVANGANHASLVNGETLRFAVADDGTLRFLPGRLEVSAGPDAGREVRFVAPPGAGGDGQVEITFGRTEGPAYRHIQLLARTVSRRHARMLLSEDHWSLQNLSATNPVILNGRPLAPDEVAPLLVDGDRIEMGEVVFTFHSR
jgi:hypothetical protein